MATLYNKDTGTTPMGVFLAALLLIVNMWFRNPMVLR